MKFLLRKSLIPYYVIAALLLYLFMINGGEEVEVTVPAKKGSVEIKEPEPEPAIDTVYIDSTDKKKGFRIVEVENPLNKRLKAAYDKAVRENDSLKQRLLFYSVIKERNYTERLEDSVQVITVKSAVVGTLKNQSISYETKPQTIKFNTARTKPVLYAGGFTRVPLSILETGQPSFGVQLQLVNKKRSFTLGLDNEKEVHFGYSLKLF